MNRVAFGWVVAALAILVFVGWYSSTAPDRAEPTTEELAADFPNYYFGGQRLWEGRPVYDVLDPEVSAAFGIEDYETYPADPPFTVVVMSPAGQLDYPSAWYLWSAISILLVAGSTWIVARTMGFLPPIAAAMSTAALLTTPARFLFVRNHVESLVLVAGVMGWLALRRAAAGRAAGWFAVATAIKMFPGMWLLGLLRRDVRAGVRGLLTAGGLLVVAAAILGLDNSLAFVGEVIPRSRQWYGTLGNYSLVSFGTALVAPWFGWLLTITGAAALLAVYLARPRHADQLWVMGTAAALLLSPLSWLNYLVLTIPALVLIACHRRWTEPAHRIGFVMLTAALVFWSPIVTGSEWSTVLLSFVPTYGLVALFVVAWKEPAWASTSETPSQT